MKERKTALAAAVAYLARRSYTEKEIQGKLRRKEYREEEIETAVGVLKQRGYLNDASFCRSLFGQYMEESRYSLRYIRCKLIQKGFAAELVRAVADDFSDPQRELAVAVKVLCRKYDSAAAMDPLAAAHYLYGRGFSAETIHQALADLEDFSAV